MKIDPTVTSTPSSAPSLSGGAQRTAQGDASTQAAPTAATPTAAAASTAAATETVNISDISTQLRASGLTGSTGDIDTKKVSEIKNQISKGQLVINAANIADGVLEEAHNLVYSRQQQ